MLKLLSYICMSHSYYNTYVTLLAYVCMSHSYCNTYVKLVIYVIGIRFRNSNIHDKHIAICSMLALECQYICHVLYSKLHNNIQPKIKCELNTFIIHIVMNPKIIVQLDAPKILHSCHQLLLLYAPNKILNTLFILNGLVHGGL